MFCYVNVAMLQCGKFKVQNRRIGSGSDLLGLVAADKAFKPLPGVLFGALIRSPQTEPESLPAVSLKGTAHAHKDIYKTSWLHFLVPCCSTNILALTSALLKPENILRFVL